MSQPPRIPRHVLPVIVVSQFMCTSIWFAGNGIMGDLVAHFDLPEGSLGHITSAIQLGFIVGTLVFALLNLADRFVPTRLFALSAVLGAALNLGISLDGLNLGWVLSFRFLTGFFLAGIYPVGMKIAADHYARGLGRSLGFLVGALVLGTAFPHFINGLSLDLEWRTVLYLTSGLALLGGLLMVGLVGNGPYRKPSPKIDLSAMLKVFRVPPFRAAALGYFGHMWELYTFWAFVPVMLTAYTGAHTETELNVPLLSFAVIAIGGPACVAGGFLAEKWGTQRTAALALTLSGLCCLLSPLVLLYAPGAVFIGFLLIWGTAVIADSPLFSTLVATNAAAETKGTALTVVNGVGFSITIVSIQTLTGLQGSIPPYLSYTVLAVGPILGLIALQRNQT
ncbi:MAG: MFS transporter [Bacteroidota bacterium]